MLSGISRLLDVYIKMRSVTMKGNINKNWYGTAALCACNQYTSTSTPLNTREPIMIGTGFHLPNNVNDKAKEISDKVARGEIQVPFNTTCRLNLPTSLLILR